MSIADALKQLFSAVRTAVCSHVAIVDALKQLFSAQQYFYVDALCEQTMPIGQRRSVITITEKASLVPAH